MSARPVVSIRLPNDVPDGTPMAVSLRSTRELRTGSWRTFRPLYVTVPSPCNLQCPAGTDVRGFLSKAAADDPVGAWRTILDHNPLPGICGRVCYHPCETNCNRVALDERLAVHVVERAVADEAARRQAARAIVDERAPLTGRTVAVIGAGPSGLSCAYHLARRGHQVTLFDEGDEPGGMLRYGIPAYRLPREVLDSEVGLLKALGVVFRPNARLGGSLPWSELNRFDAVYLAVGTQKSKPARVPGEDLPGVTPALRFLRAANAGEPVWVPARVTVIGGGNTAMDAARVALRSGASVTVAYRRGRSEMPAHPDEVAQAEREGVQFMFNAMPLAFTGQKGAVDRVEVQRTRPGQPDASGRRSPEPIPGDVVSIATDLVLTAIGEELDTDAFNGVLDLVRGRLSADRWGRTRDPKFFAGGDAATGAGTVVDAIGSGRRAALAIDSWFSGHQVPEGAEQHAVGADGLNFFYFPSASRAHQDLRDVSARAGFDEVVFGLEWGDAAGEARRCLSCGACTSCSNCVIFCPEGAASRNADGSYAIDLAHCKGCGLCVAECPRGAMMLVPENDR